jgi:sugar phosphate isomerase/epimerase
MEPDTFTQMMADNGIEICQFGAFAFNPLLPTPEAEQQVHAQIELAAALGSKSIVFSGGSYNPVHLYCAHPDNYTEQAIAQSADTLRPLVEKASAAGMVVSLEIHFATVLTTWAACKRMVEVMGVPVKLNLDAANMVRFEHYWNTVPFLREGFDIIGEHIATVHAKDIVIRDQLHLHLDECPAGEGCLDYGELLRLVDARLDPQTYVIVEHTPLEKLPAAFAHVRAAAAQNHVSILN